MKKSKKNPNSLVFLFPFKFIKEKQLSKKDVKTIKDNLVNSFANVYLIMSIIIIALLTGLSIYMRIASNDQFIEYYGLMALVGIIALVTGAFIAIILIFLAKFIENNKTALILNRVAGDLLYASAAFYTITCVYTDAEQGYTAVSEAISAGVAFLAILILIQPMHWRDAFILDVGTSLTLMGITIYCTYTYNMQSMHYYMIAALIYPFACYLIISLLFYAESQRYKELLENERLHNDAYYDSLTQCKNRHALTEYLKENVDNWENKENANILMVLFDIDDFRLYNNQFSHLGGDYCLKSICDAIRQEFKTPNLDFFRYGGEEFLLFFELDDQNEAPQYLERVRLAISKLDIIAPKGAPKSNVTISVGGLFVKNVKSFEFEKEMQIVDKYLYQAKASGKDVVCYNGSIIN